MLLKIHQNSTKFSFGLCYYPIPAVDKVCDGAISSICDCVCVCTPML